MVVPISRSWSSVCDKGLAQSSLSETSHALFSGTQPPECAVGHSAVGGCPRRVCQDTAFRSPTQLRRKYEDLLRYLLSVRPLSRRDADIRRSCNMAQIGGYLFIGGEGLLDNHVDQARRCLNVERLTIK